jgi:hypothetical protein
MAYSDSSWNEFFEQLDYESCAEEAARLFPDLVLTPTSKKRSLKINFWSSNWAALILHPDVRDPSTKLAKLFRRRFRVPFPIFKGIILRRCEESNIFGIKSPGCVRVPTEFKILIALRILGRGNVCDDINESSGVPENTCNYIFHRFCTQFAKHFFKDYVKPPTGEQKQKVMEVYAELGLHGAFGSMDATHLHWNKCPAMLRNLCKGKESYPTLGFNVVVDHFHFIHHCSNFYYGTVNDINMAHNDFYPLEIMRGSLSDVDYFLFKEDGTLQRCKGAYLIVDGGLPKVATFVNPMHERMSYNAVLWSEWLESVRKDVECTFSHLKNRFRWIGGKIDYFDPEFIEARSKWGGKGGMTLTTELLRRLANQNMLSA